MPTGDATAIIQALSSTTASIMGINTELGRVKDAITQASKKSDELSHRLNQLTWLIGIATFFGALVGLGNLALEIYKYMNP